MKKKNIWYKKQTGQTLHTHKKNVPHILQEI